MKYKYPWLAELDEHIAELLQGAYDKGVDIRAFEFNPIRLFVRSTVGRYLPSGEYAVSVWSQQVGYTTPPSVWTKLVPQLDQDYIDQQVASAHNPPVGFKPYTEFGSRMQSDAFEITGGPKAEVVKYQLVLEPVQPEPEDNQVYQAQNAVDGVAPMESDK